MEKCLRYCPKNELVSYLDLHYFLLVMLNSMVLTCKSVRAQCMYENCLLSLLRRISNLIRLKRLQNANFWLHSVAPCDAPFSPGCHFLAPASRLYENIFVMISHSTSKPIYEL